MTASAVDVSNHKALGMVPEIEENIVVSFLGLDTLRILLFHRFC